VTTRRRNFGRLGCLRRSDGALTARTFCLGVLSLGGFVEPPFGLPLRRQPAADQPQAFGVLAVTLVPTLGQVLLFTAFAQADPCAGSPRTGTTRAFWFNGKSLREPLSPNG
jgi:hypothetical protein